MARFRTTGRWWANKGARTVSGCGFKVVLDRLEGNRLIRMDRIERVSISVSGGVSGCNGVILVEDCRTWWKQYIHWILVQEVWVLTWRTPSQQSSHLAVARQ